MHGADGVDGAHAAAASGVTRVANEVVASIAALAALDVNGVHALCNRSSGSIDRLLRRPLAHRGVRVELLDDDALRIDLWVALEAGGSVSAVGADVQRRVADAIDRMLGLRLAEVNVFVSEVVFR